MNRAYSLFEIKDIDEKQRIISGIATTVTTDRMGDIVEPKGAKFNLPMPLLSQHMATSPVGHVIEARPTKTNIPVVTKMADPNKARSQTVRERLLAAWDDVAMQLVRGFSIGFSDLESEPIDKSSWARRFLTWEWLELSLVTIPANAEATIQTVKSIDSALRAASDQRRGIVKLDANILRRVGRNRSGAIYLNRSADDEPLRADSSLSTEA